MSAAPLAVESILELLKSLADLGASPAMQEVVLTWLRERNGTSQAVLDKVNVAMHDQPEPTKPTTPATSPSPPPSQEKKK